MVNETGADGGDRGDDLARAVREIQDRAEIAELPHRYTRGIDTYDLEAVLGLFADHAFIEGSRVSLPYAEYYRKLTANIAYCTRLMHYMSNEIVRVAGDRGHVDTYAMAHHWSPESLTANAAADLQLGVIYADDVAPRRRHVADHSPQGPPEVADRHVPPRVGRLVVTAGVARLCAARRTRPRDRGRVRERPGVGQSRQR